MKKTITWIGSTGFHLSKGEIKKLKEIVRLMAESMGRKPRRDEWEFYGVRPTIAKHWISLFDEHGAGALEIIEKENKE
jgi:hypothetical protein